MPTALAGPAPSLNRGPVDLLILQMRSRLRRLAAALSGALLLQLMLLGSGLPCAMHDGRTAASEHAMAGHHSAPASASAVCDDANDDACRMPQAPGQCATMTTCAVSVTASAPVAFAMLAASAAVAVPPLVATLTSGPPATPELPPPRA